MPPAEALNKVQKQERCVTFVYKIQRWCKAEYGLGDGLNIAQMPSASKGSDWEAAS